MAPAWIKGGDCLVPRAAGDKHTASTGGQLHLSSMPPTAAAHSPPLRPLLPDPAGARPLLVPELLALPRSNCRGMTSVGQRWASGNVWCFG